LRVTVTPVVDNELNDVWMISGVVVTSLGGTYYQSVGSSVNCGMTLKATGKVTVNT
jgi:hypothetical protein